MEGNNTLVSVSWELEPLTQYADDMFISAKMLHLASFLFIQSFRKLKHVHHAPAVSLCSRFTHCQILAGMRQVEIS